jgi:deoxycytidine triphosphate deaminase
MILNPRKAIENGWITGNIPEDHIQPNGIDFTIDKLYSLATKDSWFELGITSKSHVRWEPVQPTNHHFEEGLIPAWFLKAQSSYDVQSNLRVTLPADGVSALLIGRSTLNRNGLFLTSGWYDSNFDGQIGAQLRTAGVGARLAQGARIGQIIFFESDAAKAYSGQYQSKAGHWTGE